MRTILLTALAMMTLLACDPGALCTEDGDARLDQDGDGVCDAMDACPGRMDGADRDSDGVPDGCDACPTDPGGSVDSDEDGVCDEVDPCPLDALDDSDGDGSCDSQDLCPGADDGADRDGDAVPDACDNCPELEIAFPEGAVLHYAFDGDALNLGSAGAELDGVVPEGGVDLSRPGVLGSAASFDGSACIGIPDHGAVNLRHGTGQRSVGFWFQAAERPEAQVLFEEGGVANGFVLFIEDGTLYAGAWNNHGWPGEWLSAPVDDGLWHHAALVLQTSTRTAAPDGLRVYLDGIEVGRTGAGAIARHTDGACVGGVAERSLGPVGPLDAPLHGLVGAVDELALFNRALSPGEVRWLAAATNPSVDTKQDADGDGLGDLCDCDSPYVSDPSGCVPDIDTAVADVSARPIVVSFPDLLGQGQADFQIEGLSRVGWDIEVIEVPTVDGRTRKEPGLVSYPEITLRGITGAPDQVNRLVAWAGQPAHEETVQLTLIGLGAEVLVVQLNRARVVSAQTATVPAGADLKLTELVVQPQGTPAAWGSQSRGQSGIELVESYPPSAGGWDSTPCPAPGQDLEFSGIDARPCYAVGELNPPAVDSSDPLYIPRARAGNALLDWMEEATEFWTMGWPLMERRPMSVIDRDAAGDEISRINLFEVWPARIDIFDPTQAYGAVYLVNLLVVCDWVEEGW
jgi:hypothetical protein